MPDAAAFSANSWTCPRLSTCLSAAEGYKPYCWNVLELLEKDRDLELGNRLVAYQRCHVPQPFGSLLVNGKWPQWSLSHPLWKPDDSAFAFTALEGDLLSSRLRIRFFLTLVWTRMKSANLSISAYKNNVVSKSKFEDSGGSCASAHFLLVRAADHLTSARLPHAYSSSVSHCHAVKIAPESPHVYRERPTAVSREQVSDILRLIAEGSQCCGGCSWTCDAGFAAGEDAFLDEMSFMQPETGLCNLSMWNRGACGKMVDTQADRQ